MCLSPPLHVDQRLLTQQQSRGPPLLVPQRRLALKGTQVALAPALVILVAQHQCTGYRVTQGTDAQATVSVRMRDADHIASAQASDTDTVVASCRAYVQALNKLQVRREKSAPVSMVS